MKEKTPYSNISQDLLLPATAHPEEVRTHSFKYKSKTYIEDSWERLKVNKMAIISIAILIIIIFLALFTDFIAPYHYAHQEPSFGNLPPKIPWLEQFGIFDGTSIVRGEQVNRYDLQGVSTETYHYFGTDSLGRDLFSRVLYGTRISLLIGFTSALINLMIGVPYGLVSGWFGGKVDSFMMRVVEILSGIPNLVILIVLLMVIRPGITSIILALGITEWISMARIVRAETIKLKNQDYILAAKSLGTPLRQILSVHIVPNIVSVIIIQTMYAIPAAIFFEAFLSFIGLGVPAPFASLGTLINDGYQTFQFLPHLMWFPAIAISILMLSINFFANALRDALDPRYNYR